MSVDKLGTSSVTFRYRVVRCADEDRPDPVLAAEGTNVCVTVDLEAFRAVAIPERLREVFIELQS
jgi:acyl-CoA thioesterase FadM